MTRLSIKMQFIILAAILFTVLFLIIFVSLKHMENTEFRCRNLNGVFQVDADIPDGPVLLVDDAVDSRWTFTVISALLLRAGSGPVFPFAIMSTSTTG